MADWKTGRNLNTNYVRCIMSYLRLARSQAICWCNIRNAGWIVQNGIPRKVFTEFEMSSYGTLYAYH